MVITDVPFDARERAKYSRYSLIRRPDSGKQSTYGEDDEDEEVAANRSKEYATFLKYVLVYLFSLVSGLVVNDTLTVYQLDS